jgi:hypothetical protein
MIKGINTGGKYIEVVGGQAGTYVGRNYNSNAHNQGQMMYDLEAQCMKVFDGQSWIVLASSFATVNLSYQAQTALDWVEKQIAKEQHLKQAAEKYSPIKSLTDQITDLEAKLEMMLILVDEQTS